MDYFELIKFIYLFLLLLNVIGFSTVIIYKRASRLWMIFLFLVFGIISECVTLLIKYNDLLIFGKETNAPFYHLNTWTDLILFFIFFYTCQEKIKIKRVVFIIFVISFLFNLIPYFYLNVDFMHHSAWNPLISKPGVLLMCSLYFIQLLDSRQGFPFIAIGIFMYTGTSLIDMSVFPFYEGVDNWVHDLRNTINLFPLIIMHLLFMYEIYILFKKKESLEIQNITSLK